MTTPALLSKETKRNRAGDRVTYTAIFDAPRDIVTYLIRFTPDGIDARQSEKRKDDGRVFTTPRRNAAGLPAYALDVLLPMLTPEQRKLVEADTTPDAPFSGKEEKFKRMAGINICHA